MAGNIGTNKPSGRGIRDPQSNAQLNGRIVNPPRYPEVGGFTGKTKAFFKNMLHIMKPGDTKGSGS